MTDSRRQFLAGREEYIMQSVTVSIIGSKIERTSISWNSRWIWFGDATSESHRVMTCICINMGRSRGSETFAVTGRRHAQPSWERGPPEVKAKRSLGLLRL